MAHAPSGRESQRLQAGPPTCSAHGEYSALGIRINELARELGVKPSAILEILPEVGCHCKKTHSSTLDHNVALAVRSRLGGENAQSPPRRAAVVKQTSPPKKQGLQRAASPRGPKGDLVVVPGHLYSGGTVKKPAPIRVARERALATDRGYSGPSQDHTHPETTSEIENYWVERRRDGSRGYSQFRETGKFGSHPLYDDCSDE